MHLKAAEACAKAGKPFALGLSNAGDCVDFCGALFAAYRAQLVDAKGNITVVRLPLKTRIMPIVAWRCRL